MPSSLKSILVVTLAVVAGGCGVRGSLELPQEQQAQQAENSKTGADGKPQHRPFILDGLLR